MVMFIWGLPGSPVVKTSSSNAGGVGLSPGWGANIPYAFQPKKKKPKHKTEATLFFNKFNKDFKNGPH